MSEANEEKGITEFSQAVVSVAKQAKTVLCLMERGPTDSPPMLLWCGKDDVSLCEMPLPDDDNPAYQVLANALSEGFQQFGVPRFVSMVVEAYSASAEYTENIARGELQEKFEMLDPTVKEVITVLTFDMEHEIISDMIFYKYDDAGQPVYEEVLHEDSSGSTPAGGSIVDVITHFRDFCNNNDIDLEL